jgi:hypothetical protein
MPTEEDAPASSVDAGRETFCRRSGEGFSAGVNRGRRLILLCRRSLLTPAMVIVPAFSLILLLFFFFHPYSVCLINEVKALLQKKKSKIKR